MEQANIEHAEDHGLHMTPEEEYSSSKLGMWLFLGTEIMLFGGLFAAYAIFRAKYPVMFDESHLKLDRIMGGINTCILIFSSLTMAVAVTSIQRGKQIMAGWFMLITIICGLGFGVIKYFEYSAKFAHDIYPDTNIFFSIYYLMTGLHMIHVFIGLGVLAVVMVLT
ncbi:MAG: cytochrome c oxidase subunit 3, partial [Thermodesulfobacteriota bacterium]